MDVRSSVVGSRGTWVDVILLLIWSVSATIFFIVREIFEAVDRWVVRRWRRVAEVEGIVEEERDESSAERRPSVSSGGKYKSRVAEECSSSIGMTPGKGIRVFPIDPSVVGRNKAGFNSKFYAVRRGRVTGIFLSWEDCNLQVCRFRGAEFKSFGTLEEATVYLLG
ncbi:hypothetical protein KC19_5G189100 [Ceratodon purpureus]|uniref:ribonuclease H n=1 Tax=Ceratodon purpureus TaxID=3225 RepID=A0A8T0I5T5_CERPU|nr:hypothetical protein KC19_7G109800 [Ceratodon purpureus]KAG0577888.1 hypothetical protein KC19_5G189100 [Ceratodon purpureus]